MIHDGRLAFQHRSGAIASIIRKGDAGAIGSAVITLPGEPNEVSYLWLKTHRLAWREDREIARINNPRGTVRTGSKGRVRVNNGPWIPLSNATVPSAGMAGALGGPNGTYMTVVGRLAVLGIDVRAADGRSLVANSVVWDDPDTWMPPRNTPEDIAAGERL